MTNDNPNSGNYHPYQYYSNNSRNIAQQQYYQQQPHSGFPMAQEGGNSGNTPSTNDSGGLNRSQSSVNVPLTQQEYEELAKSMRHDFDTSQNR